MLFNYINNHTPPVKPTFYPSRIKMINALKTIGDLEKAAQEQKVWDEEKEINAQRRKQYTQDVRTYEALIKEDEAKQYEAWLQLSNDQKHIECENGNCKNIILLDTPELCVEYMCCGAYACYGYEDRQFCEECSEELLSDEGISGIWRYVG